MIDIYGLSALRQFSNFETFNFADKTIILYDDHRSILTALFEANRLGVINSNTNLITFDRHDDARPIHPDSWSLIDKFNKEGLSTVSSREFKDFVEFDISMEDDDWVRIAFELGLVNNLVNIGNTENLNISDLKNHIYTTKTGINHHAYTLHHINDELDSHGGSLGDMVLYEQNRIVHEIFGYNLQGEHSGFSVLVPDYVLDFDLDCFTTKCQSKTFAWPESIFASIYSNYETAYFMRQLIARSKFITICREPSFCGGIGESNKILGYLDKYFFEGSLGTRIVM